MPFHLKEQGVQILDILGVGRRGGHVKKKNPQPGTLATFCFRYFDDDNGVVDPIPSSENCLFFFFILYINVLRYF